jgi:hypothetical protein
MQVTDAVPADIFAFLCCLGPATMVLVGGSMACWSEYFQQRQRLLAMHVLVA